MSEPRRVHIVVNKSGEMRSTGISRMIDEGGLGAEEYYDVTKIPPKDQEVSKMIDEGGLGARKYYNSKETLDNIQVTSSDNKN